MEIVLSVTLYCNFMLCSGNQVCGALESGCTGWGWGGAVGQLLPPAPYQQPNTVPPPFPCASFLKGEEGTRWGGAHTHKISKRT